MFQFRLGGEILAKVRNCLEKGDIVYTCTWPQWVHIPRCLSTIGQGLMIPLILCIIIIIIKHPCFIYVTYYITLTLSAGAATAGGGGVTCPHVEVSLSKTLNPNLLPLM